MEPLAHWWARRRHTAEPAETVVARLPAGPAITPRPARSQAAIS